MFPLMFTNFLLAIGSPLLYFYIPDIRLLSPETASNNLIIDMENIERIKSNKALLEMDSRLLASAQKKACSIKSENEMSHSGFYNFIYNEGYDPKSAVGENMAANLNEIGAVSNWMLSSAHKDIILDSEFKKVGVAKCNKYIVEHFGE